MSFVLFLVVVCALMLSLIREIRKRGPDSIALTIWKFFSYYTTLSNVLVLVWFAALTFEFMYPINAFARDANVATAITFYISTVGIANYLIFGWLNLSLFERVADLMVHAVTPMIAFVYWILFAEKEQLEYSLIGYWLIFPLSYATYTMLHGRWTKFYPYEFTNVQALGPKRVSLNALALSLCLLAGGTLFIMLGKAIS